MLYGALSMCVGLMADDALGYGWGVAAVVVLSLGARVRVALAADAEEVAR
jgi:hypothetical protein